MERNGMDAYIGPITATLTVSERLVHHTHGQWWAFAESRLREASSGNTVRVWLGTVQARDADEVYVCAHTHHSILAADRCAAREAKRRAVEDMRQAHEDLTGSAGKRPVELAAGHPSSDSSRTARSRT